MLARWALRNGRPIIEIEAFSWHAGPAIACSLVADTGAGSEQSVFELVLDEATCRACAGVPMGRIQLGGAYSGAFPVYLLQVRLPSLGFDELVPVVGVSQVPAGFDGIAAFKFLSRFHYGNFGNRDQFGLDLLTVA